MDPAYDLRSNAKTKGNRPYLPPNYAPLMHLGYAVLAISLLGAAGYFGWGMWLNYQTLQVKSQAKSLDMRIKSQEQMLWLADWNNQSLPFQEVLVEYFKALPPDVRLSQLVLRHNSNDATLSIRVAINSDRNTSAQYFREMTNFFSERGMAVLSIQQNQVLGATVFEANLKIMRKFQSATKPALTNGNAAESSNTSEPPAQ